MPTINFDLEELTRDLAEQYAKGRLDTDTYLTLWEEITLAYAGGNNQNTVSV